MKEHMEDKENKDNIASFNRRKERVWLQGATNIQTGFSIKQGCQLGALYAQKHRIILVAFFHFVLPAKIEVYAIFERLFLGGGAFNRKIPM